MGQLNSVTDYLVSVLKRGIGEEILRVEQSVLSRAEEIYRASAELHPLKNAVVEYKCDEDIYRRVEHSPLGRVFSHVVLIFMILVSRGRGWGSLVTPRALQ